MYQCGDHGPTLRLVSTTQSDHRLPTTVSPSHYELVLEPDLEAATFTGRVDIDATVVEATDELVLNAAELEVSAATVTSGATSQAATVALDGGAERLTVTAAGECAHDYIATAIA